jgi:NTE family protein
MLAVSNHGVFWILQILALMQLNSNPALSESRSEQPRKRVGLALSGGGARGAAEIGVLKVLERERIKIDCIAGTSFGSIVGGLFAAGYTAEEIEGFVINHWQEIFTNQPERERAPLLQAQTLRHLLRLNLRGLKPSLPEGFLRGQNLIELINGWTLKPLLAAGYNFDLLPIPFRAVATDLLTGEPYIFKNGRMGEAIRASIAQPGIFSPVAKDGLLLVDGGLSNALPANIPAEMGADIVIAVDVSSPDRRYEEIRSAVDVIDQSITLLVRQTLKPRYEYAQLVLRPELDGYPSNSYGRMREIIDRGVAAAEWRIGEIRTLVGGVESRASETKHPGELDPVIDSIKFETTSLPSRLRKIPPPYLLRQIESRPGDNVEPGKLDDDTERLYATGMFEKVDYDLKQITETRYTLVYHVTESAPNDLGISLRYDPDYKLQGLAEVTARDLIGTTSYGTFSGRFGASGHQTAALRLIHPKAPFLFLEPQAQLLNRERFELSKQGGRATFQDKRRSAQLMLGTRVLGCLEASAGYRFETARFAPKHVGHSDVPSVNLSGLRLRVRGDTLDAQEFPRSGIRLEIQADSRTPKLGADLSYNTVQGEIQAHVSPTDKTTVTLRFAGFTSAGALPALDRAYLGGYGFSGGDSYRLVGFERDEHAVIRMAIGGVGYRRQVFAKPLSFLSKGYLSVDYNLAGIGSRPGIAANGGVINGGAVGFALDTMMGPVRVAAGIGQAGKLRLYLSLGPSF